MRLGINKPLILSLHAFSAGLIQHIIAMNQHLPEIATTSMYEYVYAGNGTFVRARREGLTAIAPVVYYKAKGRRSLLLLINKKS
ncbi:MAG: hypothetical protein NT070_16970 [Cyanobacteria bacterium]|nr:hypothetical protein [Cyanobacteriota bacterium]